jgi:hypothetical protein
MADLVSYKDSEGRTHWTAEGSRAHREHLASKPAETAEPAEAPEAPSILVKRKTA